MDRVERILHDIPAKTKADPDELGELRPMLYGLLADSERIGLPLTDDRLLVIAIHLLGFARRLKQGEPLPELEESMLDEVSPQLVQLSHRTLRSYGELAEQAIDDAEVFYLTVHFEAARNQ
ncbi:PRD domain-containing protein [Paenibacillus thiaminolyticus]|uniref:PRD domain-containing protein n=1 Tax=Paenibacillus thiaminolyticus TaxID=49283 RepID=UPI0013F619E5|nr:PRD domain-containing protein [Paenibacillus thiaminolyticus]MDG0874797.1 PRD domain-containing protein [Paenibacillus thiaminolyticus]NGP57396.1 PRD domain-containing protein [Paenibacillus thiaminolyticus]WCR27413.1 PRD domain-containing protein [Paenibacillus thiaminolyticus]